MKNLTLIFTITAFCFVNIFSNDITIDTKNTFCKTPFYANIINLELAINENNLAKVIDRLKTLSKSELGQVKDQLLTSRPN